MEQNTPFANSLSSLIGRWGIGGNASGGNPTPPTPAPSTTGPAKGGGGKTPASKKATTPAPSSSLSVNTPTKKPDEKIDTSYHALDQAYVKTKEAYGQDLLKHDTVDYSQSPKIKIAGGKDPGTEVPVQVLKDVIAAAKRNGVDPYKALAQVNLESSFGMNTGAGFGKSDLKQSSLTDILQGWNLDEGVRPQFAAQFLEQKGVPGIKATKDRVEGYKYSVENEKTVDDYLSKHPAIAKAYMEHLKGKSSLPANYNIWDSAMKRDKTGLQNYNADPRYRKNVDRYANDFKKQAEIRALVGE